MGVPIFPIRAERDGSSSSYSKSCIGALSALLIYRLQNASPPGNAQDT